MYLVWLNYYLFVKKVNSNGVDYTYGELDESVFEEVEWLIESNFIFKISDEIFPYL